MSLILTLYKKEKNYENKLKYTSLVLLLFLFVLEKRLQTEFFLNKFVVRTLQFQKAFGELLNVTMPSNLSLRRSLQYFALNSLLLHGS